jgi:transposase InsO family protein
MGLARYVVDAVLLEGRSAREVAAAHGISKSWIYALIERYRAGGYEALQPRSRRPRSCSHQTPLETVEQILKLRRELAAQGHDCGPLTIAYHLDQAGGSVPSTATIWRILRREGLIVAQPQKRPRSSLIRFEAQLPNELWQTDITHWQLAGGEHAEILNAIDDHSRLFICSHAYSYVKARDVVESFHRAAELHGLPATLLSDNGAVFTASARHGKVALQSELERLGVAAKNSRPYHPQTCGKIERLHQTLKRYLDKQQPAATLKDLQRQLDAFVHYYNDIRPHQGPARQQPSQHLLSHPPRQGRPNRQGQPAPHEPPLQNRDWESPQRPPGQASDRRPADPRHRPRRAAATPAHPGPQPHLPAHHSRLSCSASPETCVQHVPRHNSDADERTRTSTWFPRHGPEPCASTNSATSANEREAKIAHASWRAVGCKRHRRVLADGDALPSPAPSALLASTCPQRAAIVQGTRTPPSHGGNPGSNPGSGTQKALASAGVFVVRGAVCASSRATRPETRAFHPASASTFDPCRLGLNMARTGAAFDLARHWQEQGNASAGPTPPAPWL